MKYIRQFDSTGSTTRAGKVSKNLDTTRPVTCALSEAILLKLHLQSGALDVLGLIIK